jgi:hypothetical protein
MELRRLPEEGVLLLIFGYVLDLCIYLPITFRELDSEGVGMAEKWLLWLGFDKATLMRFHFAGLSMFGLALFPSILALPLDG